MTSGRLRIRDFSGLCCSIDQRYGGGQVGIKARATATIPDLFGFVGRLSLMCSQGVEPLEYEPAVIAEELMQAEHTDEKHRIVVVALDPLALASRALHPVHSSRLRDWSLRYNVIAMEKADKQSGSDPVIEAYKKDIDVTLIRENLRLTVDQRFQQLMKLQQFAEDLRRAGRKARSQK